MRHTEDGKAGHPEPQRILSRLLVIELYSLANYLMYAPPWMRAGDDPLLDLVRRIASDQQEEGVRICRLMVRRYGYAGSGRFPMQFAAYNDLALDSLVGRLIEHEGLMIDEVKECAGQLAADPEGRRLAEDVALGETQHLSLLLAQAESQGKKHQVFPAS